MEKVVKVEDGKNAIVRNATKELKGIEEITLKAMEAKCRHKNVAIVKFDCDEECSYAREEHNSEKRVHLDDRHEDDYADIAAV